MALQSSQGAGNYGQKMPSGQVVMATRRSCYGARTAGGRRVNKSEKQHDNNLQKTVQAQRQTGFEQV